ncbi:MAG TPA: chorismate-binding protein, partial [Flavobacteriales bacterium]|nr:chorismate-binding protein [Flavobacteriales bacterium]
GSSVHRRFTIAPFAGDPFSIAPDHEFLLDDEVDAESFGDIGIRPASQRGADPKGLDRTGYAAAVSKAIKHIDTGASTKVVLSRTLEADLNGIDVVQLFDAACRSLPNAMVVLANTDAHGLWLGASPERLLHCDSSSIEVDSIAGTMRTSIVPPNVDAWGDKEREEQDLVTRSIIDTLAIAGCEDVRVDGPQVLRAGSVAHLRTTIRARSEGVDVARLAADLHPTPAVGGTPKANALEVIAALEPSDRKLYAGYWGVMDGRSADLYVNIRCMEVVGGTAVLHVGAGVTAASDPERECDEVELKARTWLDLIEAQRRGG